MTSYVYEILPAKPGDAPRYVELQQKTNDPELTRHPETGEAIRRVVFGGYGALAKFTGGGKSGSGADSGAGCGCGPGGCC